MYDAFSADYDRFVNWNARLAFELPFIEERLVNLPGPFPRVLDAACGTGMHALALARRGYLTAGADLSAAMVERARENAADSNLAVPFIPAGFGELAAAFKHSPLFPFDAVLCLGNSLPHLLKPRALTAALADFRKCLRPGGVLILQNRNFDVVLAKRERWMEPQAYRTSEREWLYLRFYDYDPDGLITFNILSLHREGQDAWQQQVHSTRLAPQRRADLETALQATGFSEIAAYGSLAGAPFEPEPSGNLVLTARRI